MNTRVAMTLAVVAGCNWGAPPAPFVVGVSPSSAASGKEEILTVTATGLDSAGSVDFDDPDNSSVCDYFRVELLSAAGTVVPLGDVVRVSPSELRGRLPGNTARSDSFDVTVIDPRGRAGTLANAFKIDKCPPPFLGCDDGNDCTSGDDCNGADRCNPGTTLLADGDDCSFACTSADAPVPGTCSAAGVCDPVPGACAPAPAQCTSP